MTLTLKIDATTTDDAIEAAIPYLDMRSHAIERRDDALAVENDHQVGTVLELHDVGGVDVLWSPTYGYALVNERSGGIGSSLVLDNGTAGTPEGAALCWQGGWIGRRVEAGEGDDYDTGEVYGGVDAETVLVAWDSHVKTPAPVATLRVL
jgi:hypothetical protein